MGYFGGFLWDVYRHIFHICSALIASTRVNSLLEFHEKSKLQNQSTQAYAVEQTMVFLLRSLLGLAVRASSSIIPSTNHLNSDYCSFMNLYLLFNLISLRKASKTRNTICNCSMLDWLICLHDMFKCPDSPSMYQRPRDFTQSKRVWLKTSGGAVFSAGTFQECSCI